MKAIILVGGEGTRLRPLSMHRLKCTVPIAGRQFLEYQFAVLKRHGVKEITLSICHQPELVRAAFGDGKRYGVKLNYASEKDPLGTGGAIKNCEKFVAGREPVAVLNGDELTNWDFSRMLAVHEQNRAIITIGLTWVQDPSQFGLVYINNSARVQKFVEKPSAEEVKSHWVNAGLYIFDPAAFAAIPKDTKYSAERELFPSLLQANERVWSFCSRIYWKDIGTLAKYHQANMDVLEGHVPMMAIGKAWKGNDKLRLGTACKLHKSAQLFSPAIIGDGCEIGEEAVVGEYAILGNRVKVRPRAEIKRSVIWENVEIGEGAKLNGCVVAGGCQIGKFASINPGTVLGKDSVIPDYSQI